MKNNNDGLIFSILVLSAYHSVSNSYWFQWGVPDDWFCSAVQTRLGLNRDVVLRPCICCGQQCKGEKMSSGADDKPKARVRAQEFPRDLETEINL
jgi:hypothetical protein